MGCVSVVEKPAGNGRVLDFWIVWGEGFVSLPSSYTSPQMTHEHLHLAKVYKTVF